MVSFLKIVFSVSSLIGLVSCVQIPKTIEFDESIPFTEIDGYKFHTETFGSPTSPPIIVVHGGPGGDYEYLKSLKDLSQNYRVIFYDQRGNGLSPRVDKKHLTLESNLDDLHSIIEHYSNGEKIKLIGHSWGGMLVVGYISKYPDNVSQAIIIEPGMLYPESAKVFVNKMKASQSISGLFALIRYISAYPFIKKQDGHEGYDYVMTNILNLNKPGAPYQCENKSMPPNVFKRGGYEAFSNMLKPVMDNPDSFTYDLTMNINKYRGDLMLISSECSVFGYPFQEKYHIPKLPPQTVHNKAEGMGHNMITLNPEWSIETIEDFYN